MARGWDIAVLSLGGVLGVNARYAVASWMSTWAGDRFPWATFSVNVSGSFAIGAIATVLARWHPGSHPARLFFLVGFLGGYTTFSSFAFEGYVLAERGQAARAAAYLVGSVMAGMVAVVLGVILGLAIVGREVPPTVLAASEHVEGIDE